MNAYDFQMRAVEELQKAFGVLWRKDEPTHLILKAPTGSGKTFMTCKFIDSLQTPSPYLPPEIGDVAFFWITLNDVLARQSKEKFCDYFFPNLRNDLTMLSDCGDRLRRNAVVFVNWQKLSQTRGKERLRLRRPEDETVRKEQGDYFEDIIERTQADGRKIVMIIDESHANVETENAQDLIGKINPKLILKVSATPFKNARAEEAFYARKGRGLAEMVEVPRADVVAEGLIKETIVCQTEEDLRRFGEANIDEVMLDLAMERRRSVREEWERLGERINPLVLVQLPNDESNVPGLDVQSKEEFTRRYLMRRGVPAERIAVWMDGRPLKPEWRISENESAIDYLLFKYAAGTGWDCPRAHILVMFREVKSPVFQTQSLGRIARMAVRDRARTAGFLQLRTGYLYTTYARNLVGAAVMPQTKNRLPVNHASITQEARQEGARENVQLELGEIFDAVAVSTEIESDSATVAESTAATKEERREFVREVGRIWDEHRDGFNTDATAEATQDAIMAQVAERIEDIRGKPLTERQRREVAEVVRVNAEIHQGRRDAEVVLDEVLTSDFMSRSDYGDLGQSSEFQRCFIESLQKFFELGLFGRGDETDAERLEAHGIDTAPTLTQDVMVGTVFTADGGGAEGGGDTAVEVSRNDVEKLFTEVCYSVLRETGIGNVARSWSVLREAMRQWYRRLTIWTGDNTFDPFYRIVVKDFVKGDNSVFKRAILTAIDAYRPVLAAFIQRREAAAVRQSQPFAIRTTSSYTEDYAVYEPSEKSIRQPFYLRREYHGRENETRFIGYLEGNGEVKAWVKNADSGLEALSIRWTDEAGKARLFNPDWIVVYQNGDIGIYDTKKGITRATQSAETRGKSAALKAKIDWLNAHSRKHYRGGIVELIDGQWRTV